MTLSRILSGVPDGRRSAWRSVAACVSRACLLGAVLATPPLAAAGAAGAAGAATVTPPAHVATELPGARLAGAGAFRYFGLHIYDAQFWVGPGGYRPAAPRANRFALDLRYARSFSGNRIAASSADEMKKLGLGTAEQRADWQRRLEKILPDVVDGTRITGIHLPDQGARLYHDGKLLGEIRDPEFGYAFFAIWLDPRSTGGKLRDALLAEATPP